MGNLHIPRVIARYLFVVLAGVCTLALVELRAAGSLHDPRALEVTRPRSGERVAVTWVFDAQDLFGCQPPTSVFRQIRRHLGAQARLSAIFVGDHPHGARQFLRDERLPIELVQMSRGDYRRLFPDQPLPIVISDNGTQRDVIAKDAWMIDVSEPERELEAVIVRMAAAAVP